MSSDNPSKPPWITSEPGIHPALEPLSKEEAEKLALAAIEEARQFTNSPAAGFAGEIHKFISRAETRRENYQKSLDVFRKIGDERQIRFYQEALAQALIDLGDFQGAISATYLRKNSPTDPAGLLEIRAEAKRYAKAAACPDDEECKCKRERVEDEKGNLLDLDRHFAARKILSPCHLDSAGRRVLAKAWVCRHCGHTNIKPESPARQINYEANRKVIEFQARAAIAKDGIPPKGASDAKFLKAID